MLGEWNHPTRLQRHSCHPPKSKREKSDCSNYRGITLLSTVGKILAHVLLSRLTPILVEENTLGSQCGFHAKQSNTDMIFVFRHIQKKCSENMGLYATIIEPSKVFDTVSYEGQ